MYPAVVQGLRTTNLSPVLALDYLSHSQKHLLQVFWGDGQMCSQFLEMPNFVTMIRSVGYQENFVPNNWGGINTFIFYLYFFQ